MSRTGWKSCLDVVEDRLRHGRRWAAILGILGLCLCLQTANGASAGAPVLRVVNSFEIPGEPSIATDVRWAGERSVYLARRYDGVAELKLESGLRQTRRVVPDRETLGTRDYRAFSHLAASGGFLAFGQWIGSVAWRSLAEHSDGSVHFERKAMVYVEDVDLADDRLLVLGAMYEDPEHHRTFSPDGAVAFLGSAREDSEQRFRPVLFDPAGKGAPHLFNCGTLSLGSARFLSDGSFFIVPGFQSGAHLFNREGVLVRTWNTALLGLDADTDCGSMAQEKRQALHQEPERRADWLGQHRVVDAVLPLPSGPGLVIRSVTAGVVHWELDVLGAGRVETYAIPLRSRSIRDRIRGDYRNGEIVLLVADDNLRPESKTAASQLVVLELPKG